MKIRYIIAVIAVLASSFVLFSCIGDLDTKPLNDNDFVPDKAYGTAESYLEGMAKIYGGFVLVGNDSGSADISVGDAGASELNRSFWTIQEITTDAVKCAWVNDPWVAEMNFNTWSASRNDALFSAYNRVMMLVAYVNEFLRQTTDGALDGRGTSDELRGKVHQYRAEARFIRAYAWWMGIDVFGNIPFATEDDAVGATFPPQKSRIELFEYIESELLALTEDADLKDARANTYGRADKGAAWALLARLYLNAEVYTGTPRWADARDAAAKVIAGGYSLAAEHKTLFMGDNRTNVDVNKEMIFVTIYDKEFTKSYGGTSFIICAAISGDDADGKALIGSDGWGGVRTTYEFAKKYFDVQNADYTTGDFDSPDKRAQFWIKGKIEDMEDSGNFTQGWGVTKFSNLSSVDGSNMGSGAFSSTSYPMIRLGEIHLIYAEAVLRAAGGTSSSDATALGYLNGLRSRALNTYTAITSYNLDYIINERARELMWEGHRRTDLIRFGHYTSSSFVWPWKGGVIVGKGLDAKYTLCPIPKEEVDANPNITNNNGY